MTQFYIQTLPAHEKFPRSLRLPVPNEADHVEAKIADGVLTLSLPKAESVRPKKIRVSVH